ncbi:Putative ribonuclease H protein At1g65750 [Linum perenne]
MSIPRDSHGEDVVTWGGSRNGEFSLKSAYSLILNDAVPANRDTWKVLWGWKGPNRIRYFLLILGHGRLLTNAERVRRHMTADGRCIRCNHGSESASHILCDCHFAGALWSGLGFPITDPLWSADFNEWLQRHLTGANSLLFGIGLWHLWKARNDIVFNGDGIEASGLIHKARAYMESVISALSRDARMLDTQFVREWDEIAWEPGPPDRVTINTDGSVDARNRATAGGILRRADGLCLNAFSLNLGRCSVTRAELRGAIFGLELAWSMGLRCIELQMDSKAAIELFLSSGEPLHQHAGEVLSFRELRARDWSITIRHVYREGNKAANFLASRGHDFPFGSHLVPSSDCNLAYFLRYDCLGISEPRHVLINN